MYLPLFHKNITNAPGIVARIIQRYFLPAITEKGLISYLTNVDLEFHNTKI